jgi:hypothetical protein
LENVSTGVILYPKEIALREMYERRDQAEVEFINIWRMSTTPDWKRMRTHAAVSGVNIKYIDDQGVKTNIAKIKAVPVQLDYTVWFWTQHVERMNLIAERYLFWQQDIPNIDLYFDIKYNMIETAIPIKLHLHFGPLGDESTVAEHYEKGTIFCLRTPIKVDGWVLVGESVKTIKKINLTVYDGDDLTTDPQFEEIVVEDSNQNTELEATLRLYSRSYGSLL